MAAVRVQYLRLPTEAEALAGGYTLDDFEEDSQAEVWPDNEAAWALWTEIHSQWRAGPMGPYALDYGVLFTRMDRLHLEDDAWQQLFGDMRVMERAALDQMAQNNATTGG
jgi:hypothetical protein